MADLLSNIWEYLAAGGYVMPPLLLATVLLWFFIGYRHSELKRGSRRSVRELISRHIQGTASPPTGVVDTAVVTGLNEVRAGHDTLRPFLDDRFAQFEKQIGKYRAIIGSIVAVAPLMGLLGTVGGMIETFDSLGDMTLFSQSGGIAGGISQALFTTQMGLAVAIPGLIVKGWLDRRQQEIEMDLAQIKDILCADFDPSNSQPQVID